MIKQRTNPVSWISVEGADIKVDQFPDGSFSFSVEFNEIPSPINVHLHTTLPEAILAVAQVYWSLRTQAPEAWLVLNIETFPDQRADRVERTGQTIAAEASAFMLGSMCFDEFVVHDPHSDVCVNTLREATQGESQVTVIAGSECFYETVQELEPFAFVVAVDAGATRRARTVASDLDWPMIQADKDRVNGKVVGHKIVSADFEPAAGDTIWVVDDLCDGGATFISIAKKLRETYTFGELKLYVTHGLFSQGKQELYKHFDEIHAMFDRSL